MKIAALTLYLIGSASAFIPVSKVSPRSIIYATEEAAETPAASVASATAVSGAKDDLIELAGKLNPIVNYYDPLGLADYEFWDATNESTIGFLRHAEIKHGRVAMAAFVGYCVQSNFHFPWKMTTGGMDFPSTDLSPEQQWDALPINAKWQIIGFVGFLETWSEFTNDENAHYMRGGKPGFFPSFDYFRETVHPLPFNLFDPFGFSKKKSEEAKANGLVTEINNGRLAMLGIFGFLSADKIPGSVPLLSNIAIPYEGNPMDPFQQI